MQTRITVTKESLLPLLWVSLALLFLQILPASASPVSRVTSFVDGTVLYSADLNSEFNNLIGGINSINDAQIASNANINPLKISSSIAGPTLLRSSVSGALNVNVDGQTLTSVSNNVAIAIGGIGPYYISTSAVDNTTIVVNPQGLLGIPTGGVHSAQYATNSITIDKVLIRSVQTSATLGNVAQSNSSSGNFSTTNSSPTQVTNLSTVITTGGNPVMVSVRSVGGAFGSLGNIIQSQSNNSGTSFSSFTYSRNDGSGASVLTLFDLANNTWASGRTTQTTVPATSLNYMDFPPAGTHTYTVQLSVSSCTSGLICAATLGDVFLNAMELY